MLKRLATFKLKQSASRVQRLADPHGFEDASGSVVSSCSGLLGVQGFVFGTRGVKG